MLFTSRILQALLLLVVVPLKLAAYEQLPPLSVLGNAYDSGTGYFLYSEHHYCGKDQLQCIVQYRDSSGVVFAEKSLDYRSSPLAPALVMNDYRRGEEWQVPASESSSLVVDAGFDNYVRSIWDTVEAGDSATFPFLVVGFDRPIKMRAQRSDAQNCKAGRLCLKISLDSWFLGKFVDPIELSYSRSNKRLQHFSGISNIKGKDGETLTVDIVYQYGDEMLLVDSLQPHSGICEPNPDEQRTYPCLKNQRTLL